MILLQIGNELINIGDGPLYTVYCGLEQISITFDPMTRREPVIIRGETGLRVWRMLCNRAIINIDPSCAEC